MKQYQTIKEASEKWGISPRRIQVLCNGKRIPGAFRLGRSWALPIDAQKPADARIYGYDHSFGSSGSASVPRKAINGQTREALGLNDRHIERLDEIDNEVYSCILTLLGKSEDEFPWDMYYIGEVTDSIVYTLTHMGFRIYRPAVVTNEDGSQYIEEYEECESSE